MALIVNTSPTSNSNDVPAILRTPTWKDVANRLVSGTAPSLPDHPSGISVHPLTFEEIPERARLVTLVERTTPSHPKTPQLPALGRTITLATARLVREGGFLGSAHLVADTCGLEIEPTDDITLPIASAGNDYSDIEQPPALQLDRTITEILGPTSPCRRASRFASEDEDDEPLPQGFWHV